MCACVHGEVTRDVFPVVIHTVRQWKRVFLSAVVGDCTNKSPVIICSNYYVQLYINSFTMHLALTFTTYKVMLL